MCIRDSLRGCHLRPTHDGGDAGIPSRHARWELGGEAGLCVEVRNLLAQIQRASDRAADEIGSRASSLASLRAFFVAEVYSVTAIQRGGQPLILFAIVEDVI